MSAGKHTPGPWDRGRADGCTQIYGADGSLVAHVEPRAGNSSLIAAAPELLEALIAAEAALNKIRVCCHHTAWEATGPAVIAARATIAKATGIAQ